ncbi:Fic family protein [Kitasatospora purpeofusca]|uniref:Fic family protein n=1 Tax=Kitasatospora purpeofusca TaxID=67352 RepID=UPI0036779606
MIHQLPAAARRIKPVVPPPGAEAVPAGDRARALDALTALAAAAAHLGDPDLFHRPRARSRLHLRHVGAADPRLLAAQLASAAEHRVAAGLLAVRSVRAELAERPGERPHFTPDALAELHRLLVAADPNIPGGGGFRRTTARITWPDGQRFVVAVAPGRPLLGHMERWYRWGTRTSSPALDAAALQMLRLFTVHPFPDGNGRTARLLAQCDLVGAGLLPGLLLDLDGWVDANRDAHDRAVVAAAEGDLPRWGALFARAVTEAARHRTATLAEHRRLLAADSARVADDPTAAAVLDAFRSAPAVSADSLRDLLPVDPRPALARLRTAGILAPHPRLPGALIHPGLLALLDAPYPQSG